MKIQTKLTTDVELDIEFPYFCKYGKHYTKVISENKSITVALYDGHTEMAIKGTAVVSGIIAMSERCTEQEFNAAFSLAFTNIEYLKMEESI